LGESHLQLRPYAVTQSLLAATKLILKLDQWYSISSEPTLGTKMTPI
jgi:hypothetical protein